MQEAKELSEHNAYEYSAHPLEDNLFEWHFTVRGPEDTEFEGGRYHGRILLPSDYPFRPPEIMFLTPNGRFELHKKICLSVTGFHPEFWQPAWGIRTILLAIIAFFPTHAKGAIGGLDYTKKERARLAKESNRWRCSDCSLEAEDALTEVKSEQIATENNNVPEFLLSYKAVEPSSSKPTTDRPIRLNTRSKQEAQQDTQLRKMVLMGILVSFLAMVLYSAFYI
ncbi:ubiquitin-conjugating enzyme/RWD-like protein [Sporodiniella umbellata]|nr:ubiquitin-conjugating enzyme/RWD-like protein [Sporodiniella umbellata]